MSENKTLQYYNQNTEAFSMATLGVDFSDVQQAFLKVLPRKAHMLDFGCGSGRDSKYFLEHGYQVTAVDGIGENVSIGFRSDRAACSADAVS